jgi:alanyl-tRNA synthetase
VIGTPRLYYDDPLRDRFRARVVAHGKLGDRASVVLDETAFYPESGGQLGDRGQLGGLAVADVQVDDAGVVHHLVDGVLPEIGTEIDGAIDRTRRRIHMALHTGQHMLSRALVDEARAETVSSRLGETACTIDVDVAKLADAEVARAEALVNAIIDDDVAVRAWFPGDAELASLPLRRRPKVAEDIRIVAVGAFDFTPCGGTHCLRSAQVGQVRVTGLERYKGQMRVTFAAGSRARGLLAAESEVLRGLAREFTCGPSEVPAAVAKLRRELQAAQQALGQSRAKLAAAAAEELIRLAHAAGETLIVTTLPDGGAELARMVVKRISAEPGLAALVGAVGEDGGVALCAARGPGSTVDCGALLKGVPGARGGGSAERAEGRAPAGTTLTRP